MARDIFEYTSFDEAAVVGDLALSAVPISGGNDRRWSGTASSLETGWNGSGRCVRGPNALTFEVRFGGSSSYTSLGVKGKIRVRTLGANQDLGEIQAGVSQSLKLQLNTSDQLKLSDPTGAGPVTSATTVTDNTAWYDVEFAWYLHDTKGRWRVVWNSQEISDLTATNQDTIYSGATVLTKIVFNNANIDIDDLVFWGDTGEYADTHFLSYPGRSIRMVSLHARAAGFYTGWDNATSTGAEDWEEVDEAQIDGATSYLRAVSGLRESFAMEAMPADPGIYQILLARTSISHATQTGTAQGQAFLRYAGSNYDGVTLGNAGSANGSDQWLSGWFRTDIWANVPGTATAWEDEVVADAITTINATEVGFEQTGFFKTLISQVTLNILYVSQPAPTPPVLQSGLVRLRKLHRLVKTWFVQRTDGIEFAFTDHDRALFLDSVTYQPAGGFSGSAIRRELMLKDQSQEFLGIVSSDVITVDDLRAGRYRDATIVERIVDWRYPWRGDVQRAIYWIQEVQWNGRAWKVELAGLAHRLQRKRGIIVGRTCRWDLFGPGCLVNPVAHTFTGIGVGSVVDRYTFLASGLGAFADDWFNQGDIVWATGANEGIVSEVRDYTGSNDRIELYLRTPFPITTSDTFTIRTGCDKLPATCKTKFGNFPNFGGFPFIPGRNKALRGR